MNAASALQRWAYQTLVAAESVTIIDYASRRIEIPVFDSNTRPEVIPCIRLGEGQEVPADDVVGRYMQTFLDFHVFTAPDDGLALNKRIAGEIAKALRRPQIRTVLDDGGDYIAIDIKQASARFFRDPSQEGHGVLTIVAVIQGP